MELSSMEGILRAVEAGIGITTMWIGPSIS